MHLTLLLTWFPVLLAVTAGARRLNELETEAREQCQKQCVDSAENEQQMCSQSKMKDDSWCQNFDVKERIKHCESRLYSCVFWKIATPKAHEHLFECKKRIKTNLSKNCLTKAIENPNEQQLSAKQQQSTMGQRASDANAQCEEKCAQEKENHKKHCAEYPEQSFCKDFDENKHTGKCMNSCVFRRISTPGADITNRQCMRNCYSDCQKTLIEEKEKEEKEKEGKEKEEKENTAKDEDCKNRSIEELNRVVRRCLKDAYSVSPYPECEKFDIERYETRCLFYKLDSEAKNTYNECADTCVQNCYKNSLETLVNAKEVITKKDAESQCQTPCENKTSLFTEYCRKNAQSNELPAACQNWDENEFNQYCRTRCVFWKTATRSAQEMLDECNAGIYEESDAICMKEALEATKNQQQQTEQPTPRPTPHPKQPTVRPNGEQLAKCNRQCLYDFDQRQSHQKTTTTTTTDFDLNGTSTTMPAAVSVTSMAVCGIFLLTGFGIGIFAKNQRQRNHDYGLLLDYDQIPNVSDEEAITTPRI